jgi:hypothetical protein
MLMLMTLDLLFIDELGHWSYAYIALTTGWIQVCL